MPSELMDGSRGVSTSSHFYEDIGFSERQVGFWESTAMTDLKGMDGMLLNVSKSVASSPLEKSSALGTQCMPETYLAKSREESVVGKEATKNILKPSDRPLKPRSDSSMQPEIYSLAAKRIDINGSQYESSLFSCSLSEILSRKMNLSGNVLHPQPTSGLASQNEKEPVESLEEIEAKTIGSLLPDEEDLFSGMTNELGYSTNVDNGDDFEDFDLFSSGGGMELEGNIRLSAMRKGSDFIQVVPNGSIVGEHPSRTLFVRNINSSVEDSELKSIFEQYGDIRTLYTACKNRGFVMISYYDLRAAQNAMASLQNKLFRCRKLDIHYSIPKDNPLEKDVNQGILAVFNLDSSISNEELCQIYAIYGDIKEVRETPYKKNHKFIEFYDSRAAEIALRALNKIDIAGINLEPSQIPSFHPHSLPEYHDNFINSARVVSNGHSMEFNRGVFGSSGNGNIPPHIWSNSNSYQHHPPSPVMWSNSPLLAASVHAHHLQQISGYPRAPPYVLNSASPGNHHVGSAPAVNPSLWDRGRIFSGESPEASNFHLGSLRSVGSPLNAMEIASHNIYPRVGGIGQVSPMHVSFDYPNEHVKNLSHRRNEANSNADKKQYKLNVDRIICGEDTRTTLMIKNIPNKYTSKMLLAAIDEYCRGYYDFIYLPIDFKNKCNVGYAFINMVDPQKIIPFYQAFNGKKWEKFNSEKVAYLAYARIQGKAALVTHFQNSSLMNEDKRCRPILFHTAGPNAGDQEPFPMGSNIRSRPGKGRSSGNEDNNQGSLSTVGDGEDSCNGSDSSSGSVKNSD